MFIRAAALCLVFASFASAAIVYEPVQYEYQFQYPKGPGPKFYYGGSNPVVFDRMDRIGCLNQGALGTHEGIGNYYGLLHRNRWNTPPYVFVDCLPGTNASLYGFGPADARDAANNNVPRYFRNADLLAAGMTSADGSWVIPAQAQPLPRIELKPYRAETRPAPHPILIIPKDALTPKAPANPVAQAG